MTRVLLVDDAPELTDLLGRQLTRLGFEVQCADSLETAVAAQAAAPFDVLVTDLNLPDGDGIELAERLGVRTRVALTGSADPALTARLSGAGFAAVLLKPVASAQLATVIRLAAQTTAPPRSS